MRYTVKRFPLERLERFSVKEVENINRIVSLRKHFSEGCEKAGRAVAEFTSMPCAIELVYSGNLRSLSIEEGCIIENCLFARLESLYCGAEVVVVLTRSCVEELFCSVMKTGSALTVPDDSVLLGFVATLILNVLSEAGQDVFGFRLCSCASGNLHTVDGKFYRVDFKFKFGRKAEFVTVLIREEELRKFTNTMLTHKWWVNSSVQLKNLYVDVSIICAREVISADELDGISEGDVVVFDRLTGGVDITEESPAMVAVAGERSYLFAICSKTSDSRGVKIKEVLLPQMEIKMDDEAKPKVSFDDSTDEKTEISSVARADEGLSRIGSIPVEVVVEAGRMRMNVCEIAALKEGTIINLKRPLSSDVVLRASDRVLAYGTLVSIEGEMGVQIIKVVRGN